MCCIVAVMWGRKPKLGSRWNPTSSTVWSCKYIQFGKQISLVCMWDKSCLLATKMSDCKIEIILWHYGSVLRSHFQVFLYRLIIYTTSHFSKLSAPGILCNPVLEYFREMKSKNKDENSEAFIHTLHCVQSFSFFLSPFSLPHKNVGEM